MMVGAARPRFEVPKERGMEIAAAFFAATRNGDMQELRSLLAADVTVFSDGGGKMPAATRPIAGVDNVMRLHASLARLFAERRQRTCSDDEVAALQRCAPRRHGYGAPAP